MSVIPNDLGPPSPTAPTPLASALDPLSPIQSSSQPHPQTPFKARVDTNNNDNDNESDTESLPSPTTAGTHSPDLLGSHSSMSSQDDEDEYGGGGSTADREWREMLQQLELVLTMIVVPYLGKYYGRRAAFWGWAKYMEWKYPVSVEITNPGLFRASGAVEAASAL